MGTAARVYDRVVLPTGRFARWQFEGMRDTSRLVRRWAWFSHYEALAAPWRDEIRDAYAGYEWPVSHLTYAASLRLATLLLVLCDALQPRRILDTGSGFSSFVFRTWGAKQDANVHVTSVDHDPEWLARTREYLERAGLGTEDLVTWEEFASRPADADGYDLVLHDLGGGMDNRRATLGRVLRTVAPGGSAALDDVHQPGYGRYARRTLRELGFEPFSLREQTLDGFGRFAMLGIRG